MIQLQLMAMDFAWPICATFVTFKAAQSHAKLSRGPRSFACSVQGQWSPKSGQPSFVVACMKAEVAQPEVPQNLLLLGCRGHPAKGG